MALDPEQYLRTVQREYLDFIDDDVSTNKPVKFSCLHVVICIDDVVYKSDRNNVIVVVLYGALSLKLCIILYIKTDPLMAKYL